MSTAATLFVAVMAFLLTMAWSRQSAESYLASRTNIIFAGERHNAWYMTEAVEKKCIYSADCYLYAQSLPMTRLKTTDFIMDFPKAVGPSDYALVRFATQVDPEDFKSLKDFKTLTITLPRFIYRQADVFLDGVFQSTSFDGDLISITFDPFASIRNRTSIEVVFDVQGSQRTMFPVTIGKLESSMAIMTLGELRRYQEFIATNRAGRGDTIGQVARIVMAVFVLILFLLVDGSPETLGLGVFLGFEAFAITLGYGWLPMSNPDLLRHYAFQMGDIFRLYFFLQLARMTDKRLGPWFFWGSVISIPYAYLRYWGALNDIGGMHYLSNARDFIVGGIGTLVCIRAAWFLRGKQLPWRVTALVVAALGAFEQVLDPALDFAQGFISYSSFVPITDIYQPLAAWLVAFSAFINISTMENRVRALSAMEAKAKDIQKEMELGQTVQKTFLTMPSIPDSLGLVAHHDPMLYVSGDTYFANWNEADGRMVFLINDATGHGVQAALKASGVNVIANSIWRHPSGRSLQGFEAFNSYHQSVERFYRQLAIEADIVAFAGMEFEPATGRAIFFRVNFPFPFLIEPKSEHLLGEESRRTDQYRITMLPLSSGHFVELTLKPGTVVVMMSDGFIDTSRKATDLQRYLRKHLNDPLFVVSEANIKELILKCSLFKAEQLTDDRTLIVFKYIKELRPAANPADIAYPQVS
jgi:serine phosphatase RsbU (regulator of sigma subunit)